MANAEITVDGEGSGSSSGTVRRFRTIDDVPISYLNKLSRKEFNEVFKNFDKEAMAERDRKREENMKNKMLANQPKLVSVDRSDAIAIQIDGPSTKAANKSVYYCLLLFQINSTTNNIVFLRLAPPNPDRNNKRSFKKFKEHSVNKACNFIHKTKRSEFRVLCHNHASGAVDVYNNHSKNHKLRLERIVAALRNVVHNKFVYVTFIATDNANRKGIYQAAVVEIYGVYYLGFLRDYSNAKNIAVMSITGPDVEQDLKERWEEFICACF